MARKIPPSSPSFMRSALPALAFVFGLVVLVVAAYGTGYSALPPSEKRYAATKADADLLKADAKSAVYRDKWLRLAEEFLDIYTRDTQWANRPAALYRSAEMMEELGARSFAPKDYRVAVERYERVAEKHAASRLADDALLRAAIIRVRHLHDREGALRVLRQIRTQYPRGDMSAEAARLEKALVAADAVPAKPVEKAPPAKESASAVDTPGKKGKSDKVDKSGTPNRPAPAALTRIAWATLSKDKVQITVELDRPAPWQARMREASGKGGEAHLELVLSNTTPTPQVKSGATVTGSMLTRVQVGVDAAKGTTLTFDVSRAKRYDTRVEQTPFRIVLTVTASSGSSPRGVGSRVGFAESVCPTPDTARVAVARKAVRERGVQEVRATRAAVAGDLATQLGLTVQTVFIDAGHGGKDPGTLHHGIVERDVVLDIARRVGRLLKAHGLEVEFSRTGDVSVPLSARPRKANSVNADLFVSIHINASNEASAQGFETFYLDLARSASAAKVATLENAASDRKLGDMQSVLAEVMLNARTRESHRLAEDIHRMAVSRLSRRGYETRGGGTRSAPFHVLIGAGMPAVLVEVGYCTHTGEAKLLNTQQYRHVLAEGIAEGILAYRNRLQHRHSAQFTLTRSEDSAI